MRYKAKKQKKYQMNIAKRTKKQYMNKLALKQIECENLFLSQAKTSILSLNILHRIYFHIDDKMRYKRVTIM